MSEGDDQTFKNQDGTPITPATPAVDEQEEATIVPVLVRFETNFGDFVVKIDPETTPSPAATSGVVMRDFM